MLKFFTFIRVPNPHFIPKIVFYEKQLLVQFRVTRQGEGGLKAPSTYLEFKSGFYVYYSSDFAVGGRGANKDDFLNYDPRDKFQLLTWYLQISFSSTHESQLVKTQPPNTFSLYHLFHQVRKVLFLSTQKDLSIYLLYFKPVVKNLLEAQVDTNKNHSFHKFLMQRFTFEYFEQLKKSNTSLSISFTIKNSRKTKNAF